MDDDSAEERDVPTRAQGRERIGRCGWIALGLVLLLVPGIFPGSFISGLAGMETVGQFLGHRPGDTLFSRLIVLAGMIMGILITSVFIVSVVFLMMAGRRFAARLSHRFFPVQKKRSA